MSYTEALESARRRINERIDLQAKLAMQDFRWLCFGAKIRMDRRFRWQARSLGQIRGWRKRREIAQEIHPSKK